MKKLLALILTAATLLTLVACGSKYKPVASTESELKVIARLELDGKTYDVKYELYRALFLSNKTAVDGGDNSVWSGENADEYVSKINEIIFNKASIIYSAIHTAESLGYDMYSSEVDDAIEEYIRISVEGNGDNVTGHGSYDAFLASLKESNMNYAVGELMFRYAIAMQKINEYYVGNVDALGESNAEFEFTEANVRDFYFGEDCVRLLNAFVQEGIRDYNGMLDMRETIDMKATDLEVAYYIIGATSMTASEILYDGKVTGTVVGRYALDSAYYSEYTEAAFATKSGDVSEIITISGINDGYSDGYYLVYVLDKSEAYYTEHYDEISAEYVSNAIGKLLYDTAAGLRGRISYTDNYSALSHAEIGMN